MAKNGVDGVYSADPKLDPTPTFIPEITHMEALQRGLRVMDAHGADAVHGEPAADPRLQHGR